MIKLAIIAITALAVAPAFAMDVPKGAVPLTPVEMSDTRGASNAFVFAEQNGDFFSFTSPTLNITGFIVSGGQGDTVTLSANGVTIFVK